MNTFRKGAEHATHIAGIARNVADNIRDAQFMYMLTRVKQLSPAKDWPGIRNAHVRAHAARIGVK